MSLSEHMGNPSTGGHFGEKSVIGDMSDRCSVFQHKHKKQAGTVRYVIVSCGERNAWKFLTSFERTLQKLRWHYPQVMPNLKASMEDSTLHSVSVVAVVSERQGENYFSLNQKPIAQPDRAR